MAHLVRSKGLDALKADPFVDITVICKEKEWSVHRTYLCGESQAMIRHCTRMKEVTEGRVYFPSDEPAAIEQLLKFQYTSCYSDTDILPKSGDASANLQCRYGPPFLGVRPANPNVLFGSPESERYVPVDTMDPSNDAPQWTTQHGMASSIFNFTFGQTGLQCSTSTTIERATKEQITSVFQLNVQMYALALRFGLEDLKTASLWKIKTSEHYLRYCELDKVLDTVYELTSPDDTDLRLWLFQRCVANYKIIQLMPGAVQKLSEHDVKIAGPDRYCAWTFEVAKHMYEAEFCRREEELAGVRRQFAASDTRRDEEVAELRTRLKEAKEELRPQSRANGRKTREIEVLQQQNHALRQGAVASQAQIQFLRQLSGYQGAL